MQPGIVAAGERILSFISSFHCFFRQKKIFFLKKAAINTYIKNKKIKNKNKYIEKLDELVAANSSIKKNIEELFANMKCSYQKVGLVKYDAFNEMGGKLSFSLAMLNGKDDGFVLNAVHSREGCYTYIKEIVGGNSIIVLADEEQEALNMAKEANMPAEK